MSEKIPKNGQEALYLVDGKQFLHLQKADGGVDYTVHDAHSKIHMSGGHISDETVAKAPYQSYLKSARMEVFRAEGIKPRQVERINPIIASDFYKNEILKPSWEMAAEKEALGKQSFEVPSQEPNSPNPMTASNRVGRIADALFGQESAKSEMPRQKESVLNQLKEPSPIKVKPHIKTKETPSL